MDSAVVLFAAVPSLPSVAARSPQAPQSAAQAVGIEQVAVDMGRSPVHFDADSRSFERLWVQEVALLRPRVQLVAQLLAQAWLPLETADRCFDHRSVRQPPLLR